MSEAILLILAAFAGLVTAVLIILVALVALVVGVVAAVVAIAEQAQRLWRFIVWRAGLGGGVSALLVLPGLETGNLVEQAARAYATLMALAILLPLGLAFWAGWWLRGRRERRVYVGAGFRELHVARDPRGRR